MPPRVFMPIRNRRRQSEIRPIDPLVQAMTRGSLLIAFGFLCILAGVLVSIFAMKPKTTTRYRPMRTYVIGQTQPPFRTPKERPPEEDGGGLNLSLILGPMLALSGVTVSVAGAIYYAISYRRKKQKDKEANMQAAVDEEGARESSPIESSPSALNLACPDIATSVSDLQMNTTLTSESL